MVGPSRVKCQPWINLSSKNECVHEERQKFPDNEASIDPPECGPHDDKIGEQFECQTGDDFQWLNLP